MATNTIVMGINIKQNGNALSQVYGHWFPEVARKGTLSTTGLAKHMSDHGSLVSEEVLRLVLGQLVKCIPELVSQGVPVKLDGLGIFYPTVKSKKGGATTVEEASQMGADGLVEGVRLRFIPEQEDLRELTSKAMKKKCSLQLDNVITLERITEEVNGQTVVKRRLQTLQPIADYLYGQGNGNDGGNGSGDGGEPTIRP